MKKNRKLMMYGTLFFTLSLLLSGCVSRTSSGKPTGFIWTYIGKPVGDMITWIANFLGGTNSYGWAIIIITFVIRMILLPLMLNQTKKSTMQQEKMVGVKPQLDLIQEAQKSATTQEEKAKLSQQMMDVYKQNGLSMTGGIGCLPMLIQLPIFSALYAAIQYIPNIEQITFLGISLGKRSILFAVLGAIMYAIQGYMSMIGLPDAQKKQMKTMIWMSPIMTFVFTLISNAGLGLYFVVGGFISIIQQTITTFIQRPKIKAQVDKELKENPPKIVVTPAMFASATPVKATSKTQQKESQKNRSRNAGKQQRHQ